MSLKTYIESKPVNERQPAIKHIAKELGVHVSSVKHWMSGYRVPRASKLKKLSEITGIQVNDLLPKDTLPQPPEATNPPS